jgi:hypothetical protein
MTVGFPIGKYESPPKGVAEYIKRRAAVTYICAADLRVPGPCLYTGTLRSRSG